MNKTIAEVGAEDGRAFAEAMKPNQRFISAIKAEYKNLSTVNLIEIYYGHKMVGAWCSPDHSTPPASISPEIIADTKAKLIVGIEEKQEPAEINTLLSRLDFMASEEGKSCHQKEYCLLTTPLPEMGTAFVELIMERAKKSS